MAVWRSSTAFCSVLSSALCLLALAAPASAQDTAPGLLQVGDTRLEVEMAVTPAIRERGLMFRSALPENRGMWFVFEPDAKHCLWMKNTLIPLSAAFLDAQGRVINLVDMMPQTLIPHCAAAPARYVLEVNLGWFARHGVVPGSLFPRPAH